MKMLPRIVRARIYKTDPSLIVIAEIGFCVFVDYTWTADEMRTWVSMNMVIGLICGGVE